ncbi:MAG TPA: hypothetical protein DCP28_13635 [Cytophagales bacterium]|nr:hypothetical protein [Cytophagales bacterium]
MEYTLVVTIKQDSTLNTPYFSYNNLASYTKPDSMVQAEGKLTCYFKPSYSVPMTGRLVYSDQGEHFFILFPPKSKSMAVADVKANTVTYTGGFSAVNQWMAENLYRDFWEDHSGEATDPKAVMARERKKTEHSWAGQGTGTSEEIQRLVNTAIEVRYARALVEASKTNILPLAELGNSQLFDSLSQLPLWNSPYLWSAPLAYDLMEDLLLLGSEEEWAHPVDLMRFAMDYIDPVVAESFLAPKLDVATHMNREVDHPELLHLYLVFAERYPHNPRLATIREQTMPLINYARSKAEPFRTAVVHWQDSTATKLAQILEHHRGKVIYVDFWGTWCHPCLQEMKTAMKPEYRGFPDHPDLVNLYIAHEKKTSLEQIEKVIAAYQLSGEHYLKRLTNRPIWPDFEDLPGFPTYLIVDRDGTILSESVPRPSDEAALHATLMKYLDR